MRVLPSQRIRKVEDRTSIAGPRRLGTVGLGQVEVPFTSPLAQVLPGQKLWDRPLDVANDARRMKDALAGVADLDLSKVAPLEVFSPYPLAVQPAMMARFQRAAQALAVALPALVAARFSDPEVKARLPLSPRIEALLAQIPHAYRVGSFRPDVLLGQNGDVRICEINARFPTNGYFVSEGATAALHQIGPEHRVISAHAKIRDAMMARFDLARPLHVLRSEEKGGDIHLFTQTVAARGGEPITVGPGGLSTRDGHLYADGRRVEQCVLELHQAELLGLSDPVLLALARTQNSLNDLRTVFVAHDKRLFALLSDEKLMTRLVGKVVARTLSETVAETKMVGQLDAAAQSAIVNARGEWVLKPNLFGKGKGVELGKNLSAEAMRQALQDPEHQAWVLQRYLPPAELPVVDAAASQAGLVKSEPQKVVGLLLCLDGEYFGPGIFRASSDDIVNVARGGSILVPTAAESQGRWRTRG